MPKKIYLVDGNSFIYRMFFALPEFSTKDGKIVNATFGMAKFFVGQLVKEKPDYLVFIKDAKGKNFRHELYEDYKATRDRMPDNLRCQIEDIENMLNLMGIDIVELSGYEADDIIGTLATKLGTNDDYEIDILTGDKDLYSLVTHNVKIYDTMKKKKFGVEETKDKFGIDSKMIIDYLAIVGDKADNIPGIDGFGPKKAIELINNVGNIDDIYKLSDKVQNGEIDVKDLEKSIQSCFKGKTYEKLINSKEDALLSKKLATIPLDLDLGEFDIEKYKFNPAQLANSEVIDLFNSFEFFSLIGSENKKLEKWEDKNLKVNIIGDKEGLENLLIDINASSEVTFDTETTSLDIMEAELVGLSIYLNDNNIYYINRLHDGPRVSDTELKYFLNKMLSYNITLIAHNLKYDLEIIELFLVNESAGKEEDEQLSLL